MLPAWMSFVVTSLSARLGVAGWVVVDDHDGVCVGEEGAFVDFAGVDE